jgi:outer membrane protein assembly factor BamB
VLLVALLLLGAAGGYVLYKRNQAKDVRGSSTVEFVPKEPPAPPRRVLEQGIVWPFFGYSEPQLRFARSDLQPPFRRLWSFRAGILLEFPPAIAYGRLYIADNEGDLFSLSAKTGRVRWRYRAHRCTASSPAVANGLVYVTFLNRPPCNTTRSDVNGVVAAFNARTGRMRWRRVIGPSESSPVVSDGTVYVGDWNGKVHALGARGGGVRWTYQTGGKVKGAVAVAGNRLYVGAYDGSLYALSRRGRLIWRASSQDRLGGRGTFYSTPAAAYGRVYIGSTDGKVYSFGAASGKLRWSQSTGGYVYGSPAVWREHVFIGSHSGTFYALDAATGDVDWQFRANGRISGSATVLGRFVYFSTLEGRTYALARSTGRLVWTFPDGQYTPVVADSARKRLYLVGHTRLYAMAPVKRAR